MADITSDTQIHGRPLSITFIFGIPLLGGVGVGNAWKCPGSFYALIFSLLVQLSSVTAFAQSKLSTESKKAIKLYEKGQEKSKERDFESAIELYSKALSVDPNFYEAYLRKGSLFNAMGMEDSVYTNFKKYLELTSYPPSSVLSTVASMAFRRGDYPLAQEYLEKAISINPKIVTDKEIQLLRKSIPFALEEIQKDSMLQIAPLPDVVNRFALQYLPSITIDNTELFFTKRDLIQGDEDIVVSKFQDGLWQEAQSISSRINTPLNEGACSVSADGRTLIFTSCDKRDSYGSCDLYISKRVGDSWSRPKNVGKPVSSRYWESQPSLSSDGKTLFFASTRPGGKGGRDIWVSYQQDGKWTVPINIGDHVNTFRDETTPFIHPNGETLYFSSNGHVGMGGFDLYQVTLKDSTWSEVKNLGYPINTYADEVALLIAGDGRTAYFAKEKERNYELVESQLVSFELEDKLKIRPATYVIGRVLNDETSEPLRAKLEVYDLNQDQLLFKATSDSLSGEYVMVLPSARELGCYVKKKGFLFYDYSFYSEPNSLAVPDTIDIRLKPIAVNQSLVLQNIYFDINSYQLRDKSNTEIRSVVEILEENPYMSVEISGHTDNTGTRTYNLTLSKNRAKEVYNQLVKFGISEARIKYIGFGDAKPIAANDSEEGRQSNRRIEFRVLRLEP